MDILNKIIILRDRAGMKQEDVAKLLGISKSSYHRKEKGMTQFTIEEFDELLRIFNATYSDIKDMDFPIVHKELISEKLLSNLERTINGSCNISADWNINREQYNNIQRALTPVLKEREHSFDFPELNMACISNGTVVKEVLLDIRAEKLIHKAMELQKSLAHAIFGADM